LVNWSVIKQPIPSSPTLSNSVNPVLCSLHLTRCHIMPSTNSKFTRVSSTSNRISSERRTEIYLTIVEQRKITVLSMLQADLSLQHRHQQDNTFVYATSWSQHRQQKHDHHQSLVSRRTEEETVETLHNDLQSMTQKTYKNTLYY